MLILWLLTTCIPIVCGLSAHVFGIFIDNLNLEVINFKDFAKAHMKIYESVVYFSRISGYLVVGIMSVCVWTFTFGLFEVYDVLMKDITELERVFYALLMFFGGLHFSVLIVIWILFCDNTAQRKAVSWIQDLHKKCYFEHLRTKESKKVHIISMQLEHAKILFSTGLFEINWKIFLTVENFKFYYILRL